MIGIEGRQHAVHGAEETGSSAASLMPLLVHALEEGLGAVMHAAPQAGGEPREQRTCRPVPAVPEVAGGLAQRRCLDLVDQAGLAVRALVPVIHGVEHGVGLMQHQHRAFLDQIEILVGHHQGDFQHRVGIGIEAGHFHVDPDQMRRVLWHG
jgi:hypothetical protein